MLVDDPKDYEELHEIALDQELCIHITEDMLAMSPDQTNGYSGSLSVNSLCSPTRTVQNKNNANILLYLQRTKVISSCSVLS